MTTGFHPRLNGSFGDAQEAQDVVGEAIDDEFLGAILTELAESRSLDITWTVRGERWQPTPNPTPQQIIENMKDI